MTLKKVGTPEKIKNIVTSEEDFEKLKDKIAQENDLARCGNCEKLICKFGDSGTIMNVKKNKLDVIADVKSAFIKCPKCGKVTQVK